MYCVMHDDSLTIPAAAVALPSFSLSALSPDGGMAAYLRRVNAAPVLTAAEEKQYAETYRQNGDISAARALAVSHLRLVVALARKYSGYGLDRGDIIQEGNIGLLNAIKRFDPSMGARLATFATYWIRAEIHDFIMRNWRIVKIATTKAQRKLFFHMGRLLRKDAAGKMEKEADIARDLEVGADDVRQMRERIHNTNLLQAEDGGALDTADNAESTEQKLVAKDESRRRVAALKTAMETLDERSRDIILARKLSENPRPLRELADKYGVSIERVRQLEARAMKNLGSEIRAQAA
ncbi:MAG: RNA polymerase factor sigma-32 [Gammaproteobacteria bacterium]